MTSIYAVSSGKGKAGVAIVRISGKDANKALEAFGLPQDIEPRKALFSRVLDKKGDGSVIDHALVLFFKGPHSFTGEDILELHLHGSIAVVEKVFGVLGKLDDFRLAEPGEFSKRAFDNGKMDLLQAEGLADLIEAETSAQANQAMRQMEGENSKIYFNWRKDIIEVMAFIEAYIDFPEEDIPSDLDKQAQEKIKNIASDIEKQISNNKGERIRNGIVATIIGAPNVGKSTLINFLSRRDVAIVSDIAGTTRDTLETHLNIDGYPLTVIDTAGIRKTNDAIEKEGVKRALEKASNADMRIILFEGEKPEFENEEIKKYLKDKNSLIIQNKIDASKKIEKLDGRKVIAVSLKENINTDKIFAEIKILMENLLGNSENALVTRKRHKEALENCIAELNGFIDARKNKLPIELCAEYLRRASFFLGKIVGKIGVEDILDKIFLEFCIGK